MSRHYQVRSLTWLTRILKDKVCPFCEGCNFVAIPLKKPQWKRYKNVFFKCVLCDGVEGHISASVLFNISISAFEKEVDRVIKHLASIRSMEVLRELELGPSSDEQVADWRRLHSSAVLVGY